MPNSATFFNKEMNITERVPPTVVFGCVSCDWSGVVAELAFINGFSCCPICYEYDVRVQNHMVNFNV